MNEYGELTDREFIGFAHRYLKKCVIESKSDEKIDIQIYTKLVELDAKLEKKGRVERLIVGILSHVECGPYHQRRDAPPFTKPSEQLYWCLNYTTRPDIIKV